MTRIMHLTTPHRDRGSAPVKPVTMQNVLAIGSPLDAPMTKPRHAELELLDRVRIWINEGGGGGDVQ
jgi:hypothetical protein